MSFIPHHINENKNFISGWYIDKNLCQNIIDTYKKRKILGVTDTTNLRNYTAINLHRLSSELEKEYHNTILKLLDLYKQEYPYIATCGLIKVTEFKPDNEDIFTVFQVQRYHPNRFYSTLHCENAALADTQQRCLAFMTYLNDIDEGGGTTFPHQNFDCKPEQGLTLIWPAYWTHPHMGIVAPKETKYIITSWFEFVVK